jgi:UDP-N-acetylglucosamine--dolichyl-phosphate N-acetylglucosaminephosphotransferase
MTLQQAITTAFATAFIVTFACTQYLIRKLREKRIVGVDGHKPDKPEIPEMGGIAVLIGYSIALITGSLLYPQSNPGFSLTPIAAALGAFLLAGLIGAVDDIKKLHHYQKPILLLLASTPIILLKAGVPEINLLYYTIDFTSLGGYDISVLYWLVIVPLGITGAGNVVNMLAGFNGLMSGLAVISCGTMALISLAYSQPTALLIFTTMVGAQLAFLYFNRYPARIFPGDVGTLSFGTLYAAGIIIGNMEFIGFLAFLVYIVNASMSLLSVGRFFEEKQFREEKMSALNVTPDGLISFTRLEKPVTLCRLLLHNRPQKENILVFKVFVLSIISSLITIALVWR